MQPGDVVTANFVGATGTKRRPCVVVSTHLYHKHHPDVLLAVITTQLQAATTPTDYILQDWAAAGLNSPSAVRTYLGTRLTSQVSFVGQLSDRDWQEVQARLKLALATS